jgi:hypothetical protein
MLTNPPYAHGAVEKYSNQTGNGFVVNDMASDVCTLFALLKQAVQKFAVQSDGMANVLGLSLGVYTLTTGTTYTVTAAETIVLVDSATGGAKTITLPLATTYTGRIIVVKDAKGTAGTDNITVDGNGSETVDGTANVVINTNYGKVGLVSDGTKWSVVI